jgi:tripeptidyl-peptidase-1
MVGIAGTSAASPVVAAIFARLNAKRAEAGKPPMGYLNPWIYQNAQAFNDVTKGINNGGVGKNGFQASTGWDPATGFGTFKREEDVILFFKYSV